MLDATQAKVDLRRSLEPIPQYLTRPVGLFATYDRASLRSDLIAGITVAVILLPQAIAFALIAELPPQMGLYSAIVGAIVGALWGSSNQAHTGPTNAISLLVASALLAGFAPGSSEFVLAAGLMAVMAGLFQLVLGLARLGFLVNFVSHSVIVGFAAGAGLLIAIRQVPALLGIELASHGFFETLIEVGASISGADLATLTLGVGTVALIVVLQILFPRLPASLIAMILASAVVFAMRLDESGVAVIGQLPRGLPPLAHLPLLNLDFISRLSTGALAVGAIGLVETVAISRSIATHTGQRLDSSQEFVGQGLANILSGFFSGYPGASSFSRSAVNFEAGARTPLAAIISSIVVLLSLLVLAPMAAFLPRAALAGVLIVVAYRMIDRAEISRIWQGSLGDAVIMVVTFAGTLLLEISFAVLLGIMFSFVRYIIRTSMPRVLEVVPDSDFEHFVHRADRPSCPQLGIIDILGDLYFGAVHHVEEAILQHADANPGQRFLMIRMHHVNNCDFSGIHMLENALRHYRDRGGDVFMVRINHQVNRLMNSTGFDSHIGRDNLLDSDRAVSQLFHHVLDPAVCIYECPVRVFAECENLPKQLYIEDAILSGRDVQAVAVRTIEPRALWDMIRKGEPSFTVVDVREPREYRNGHIPKADLVPLPRILSGRHTFATGEEHRIVLVCRSGRRSRQAAVRLAKKGCQNVEIVDGGMLAWEAAGLLEAIE
jgi:sulfate permease, SulP family